MDTQDDPGSEAPPPSIEIDMPFLHLARLGGYVVGIVFLVTAVARTQGLIGGTLAAAVLAAVTSPGVARLGRLVRSDVAAAVVVHVVVFVSLLLGAAVLLSEVRTASEDLREFTEERLAESDATDEVAPTTRVALANRLAETAADWGWVTVAGDDEAVGIAVRTSQLAIMVVLSLFFVAGGGGVVDATIRLVEDREQRRRARTLWSVGVGTAATHVRRVAVIGIANGVAAGVVAAALHLPSVLLVAAAAGFAAWVPLLGTVVGWSPLVALAVLGDTSDGGVAVAVVVALAAVTVSTWFRHRSPPVDATDPGRFLPAIGLAAGTSAGGLIGAPVGLFVAVAVGRALAHPDAPALLIGATAEPRFPDRPREGLAPGDADESTALADSMHGDRLRARFSVRTVRSVAVLVVVAVALQLAISRIGLVMVWAVVGTLLAVGLDGPISWFARRARVTRSVVVIVTGAGVAAALVALVSSARTGLGPALDLAAGVPGVVASLESLPLVGDTIAGWDLVPRVDAALDRAERLLVVGPLATRTAGVVTGGIGAVFWIATITGAALLDGPRLVDAIRRRIPAPFVRQVVRLGRVARATIAGYVAGTALVAALNGTIVAVVALLLGLPAPIALAVWAFSWNFVPQVGAVIGWAPLLVFALVAGPGLGLAVLVGFVVYQAVENNLVQPTIIGRAVDVSALAALGAALVGGAVAGLIGAVLAIPVLGLARALRAEVGRDDFPSLATRRPVRPEDGSGPLD